jgi:divalent metal cation (Fe/Co/Zn/Cd) transporter
VRNQTKSDVNVPLQLDVLRRILRIQVFTLIWMCLEAAVSLSAAWRAHSPALLAFGGDSAIELVSALVVYWRFRYHSTEMKAEKLANRIAGGLLFALAAYVLMASGAALFGNREVHSSLTGIALLLVAAMVMPWLAGQKRELSNTAASAALRADAAESAVCGYMAWIGLAGLLVNAAWGIRWADPVAALCLTPFILREGWEAVRGRSCECH